ncbi:AzlD domain-containing protein [Desulfoplanes formicivorans]|uniref:Branched-chain amino acid ABC transporter n=1 Tax=Desulfoplanes formicivorans TaxID=1592317 RepID=A0A194AK29_9BACT|nr:AzlD domain-containing protein [Desulfoplanes formicivorans]GAU09668.1 branched-chain amino acid ABC transporter [Desulfoplanes formicivorans]
MDQKIMFMTICGMLVVTYIPRMLPVVALASRNMPPALIRWLGFIPTTVLSALLVPDLVLRDGNLHFGMDNLFLWVALPTFLVAWRTRSFFGAIFTGMFLVAVARWMIGS